MGKFVISFSVSTEEETIDSYICIENESKESIRQLINANLRGYESASKKYEQDCVDWDERVEKEVPKGGPTGFNHKLFWQWKKENPYPTMDFPTTFHSIYYNPYEIFTLEEWFEKNRMKF